MLLVQNSFIYKTNKKTSSVLYHIHIKKTEEGDTSRAYFSLSADEE